MSINNFILRLYLENTGRSGYEYDHLNTVCSRQGHTKIFLPSSLHDFSSTTRTFADIVGDIRQTQTFLLQLFGPSSEKKRKSLINAHGPFVQNFVSLTSLLRPQLVQ